MDDAPTVVMSLDRLIDEDDVFEKDDPLDEGE